MAIPKSNSGDADLPCDFCSNQAAVLFCRADSARLCLFCDHHVHSANLLSRKHFRSQICDACRSRPVTVRCCTDDLALCQECDWDAHGGCAASASHDRAPIEGFSGVPSVYELASMWGMELCDEGEEKTLRGNRVEGQFLADVVIPVQLGFSFPDLIVPHDGATAYSNVALPRKRSPTYGRHGQVLHKQLVELFRRGLVDGGDGGGGGDNLVPGTPSRETWLPNVEGNGGADGAQQPEAPNFSSIPRLPTNHRYFGEENVVRESNLNHNGQTTQIWDFNLGQTRGHDEEPDDFGYGKNDEGFMIKSYSELMRETSLPKVLGDIFQMNCHIASEDVAFFNMQCSLSNAAISQGPATSESNNLPITRASSACKAKGSNQQKEPHFAGDPLALKDETGRNGVKTNAHMEMLAQNRGNAMLRYKEKKKTRRSFVSGTPKCVYLSSN